MPESTPKLGLKKPLANETVSRAAHNENLDLIDAHAASQSAFDAHKGASTLDHPDGSVTDAKIGNRAVDDTVIAANGADTPTRLWSKLANMVKRITGKANWFTAPAVSLEDANTHINSTAGVHGATSAATGNTIVQRDASGRFKAAAPSAADDVARKAEIDSVVSDGVKKSILLDHGTDLNTIVTSGFYRMTESPVNAPTGVAHGNMIVSRGSDTIVQLAFSYSDYKFYMRQGNPPEVGGTGIFLPWIEMIHSGGGQTIKGSLDSWGVLSYGLPGAARGALSYAQNIITLEASSADTDVKIMSTGTGRVLTNNNILDDGTGVARFGETTGGTHNGNIILGPDDRYTVVQFCSGATLKAEIMGDAATGDMYLDATRFIFRNAPNSGANVLVIANNGAITTANNMLDDGAGNASVHNMDITAPTNENTGWAKGMRFMDRNRSTTYGSIGMYGISTGGPTALNNIYIGFGAEPYNGGAAGIIIEPTGKVVTKNNILDDGGGGSMSIAGPVIVAIGGHDLNIVPYSGKAVGFTNNAVDTWLLRVNDTTGGAYTKNNILDDGAGLATFKAAVVDGAFHVRNPGNTAQKITMGYNNDRGEIQAVHDGVNYKDMVLNFFGGSVLTRNNLLDDSNGNALFGNATNGYVRIASNADAMYIQGMNATQDGSKKLRLTGMFGNPGAIETYHNVLDDGAGVMSIAGASLFTTNPGTFYIRPAAGSSIGFTNNAATQWLLRMDEDTHKVYTKHNILDDGNGHATFVDMVVTGDAAFASKPKVSMLNDAWFWSQAQTGGMNIGVGTNTTGFNVSQLDSDGAWVTTILQDDGTSLVHRGAAVVTSAGGQTINGMTTVESITSTSKMYPAMTTGSIASNSGSTGGLEVRSVDNTGASFMTFHRQGSHAVHFGVDTDNQLKIGGWSMGANAYSIWHSGNQGNSDSLLTSSKSVVGAINELFTSASNGKSAVAVAITGMGQSASGSDTYAQLASKIAAISTNANATVGQVLAGRTFYSSGLKTGTMPDRGATNLTPSGTGTVAIPAGYHNGSGVVAQVSVPAANVLTGTNIAGVAGTMPNQGAIVITPGASAKSIPAGYHNGSGTVAGSANLIPSNIRFGVQVYDVIGSLIEGKRWASGNINTGIDGFYDVGGLNFTPSIILAATDPSFSTKEIIAYFAGYNQTFVPVGGYAINSSITNITSSGFRINNAPNGYLMNWFAVE
ncbi:hypothetical protein FE784_16385 [Paenibacillus hemerocallicola]|uniref:Uncharacterized protein n=1 Tax=Paenibacillus hemerocallicola TaxID=1172614 RepID=A0A5C4T7W5_9BACL|nr:pyocin knob domain-containing protein [Paenibacillus hemerocallicola]TNJ65174.1 hypothetical protein FE784_16385 [Paenibacillus hemerocallicola]